MRQAYEMADRAMRLENPYDLILLDCPLVLDRSMVPLREAESHASYRAAFDSAIKAISGQITAKNFNLGILMVLLLWV